MTVALESTTIPQWTLGDRMRKSLSVSGIQVAEIADYLGVARNTVSTWINDHVTPNRQTLMLWAMRTGVPYEWLVNGEPPPTTTVTARYSTLRLVA